MGADHEFHNSKQYVEATQSFINNLLPEALSKVRPNGETVFYNAKTNAFAVKTADNVPKTMFRPDPADYGYKKLDYLMHNSDEINICRVCGAEQLEPPWGDDGLIPSYEICDCCGVEFGYEDMNINSLKKYREKWLENGTVWLKETEKPAGWSLDEQLKNIPEKFR